MSDKLKAFHDKTTALQSQIAELMEEWDPKTVQRAFISDVQFYLDELEAVAGELEETIAAARGAKK